jgi:hypothetical protein
MSLQEIFEQTRQIVASTTLTSEEVKLATAYFIQFNAGKSSAEVGQRLIGVAEFGVGPGPHPPGYTALHAELDMSWAKLIDKQPKHSQSLLDKLDQHPLPLPEHCTGTVDTSALAPLEATAAKLETAPAKTDQRPKPKNP